MKKLSLLLLLLLSVSLISCASPNEYGKSVKTNSVQNLIEENDDQENSSLIFDQWSTVSDNLERYLFSYDCVDECSYFEIYRFDSTKVELEVLESVTEKKSVFTWARELEGDFILINAAYFDEEGNAVGYLSSGDQVFASKMFNLNQSGFLLSDLDNVFVRRLSSVNEIADYSSLVQSFPFLVLNGEPAISEDSVLKARRTLVGEGYNGEIYVVIVPRPNLSLYELMKLIIERDLRIKNLLNLDGGPSTGIYLNAQGFEHKINSYTTVPSVILFKF